MDFSSAVHFFTVSLVPGGKRHITDHYITTQFDVLQGEQPTKPYFVDRRELDRILAQAAARAGEGLPQSLMPRLTARQWF
jgi:hypothetical protein